MTYSCLKCKSLVTPTIQLLSPKMFTSLKKYVSLKVYQYELTTSLYMLEPWEKTLFNSIIFLGFSLFAISTYHYTSFSGEGRKQMSTLLLMHYLIVELLAFICWTRGPRKQCTYLEAIDRFGRKDYVKCVEYVRYYNAGSLASTTHRFSTTLIASVL
ncbi:hypothetical protein BC937DRAFT_90602 [Endogone sp. FLAS-F59071]|nr:hypothetical protein BC937DRAFT_90602 [Endogone sp. FLAS-F59071]|eukprot:RUS16958.1 hypothetical protein BC937DRAFT_90602 [Endogone sp. FLAS-F59071]